MRKGLIHIYYGDGKGKTTCALGMALRALGNGLRVQLYQFLKDAPSGEIEALKRFERAEVFRAGAGCGKIPLANGSGRTRGVPRGAKTAVGIEHVPARWIPGRIF